MNKFFHRGNKSPDLVHFMNMMRLHNYEFFTKIIVDTATKKVFLFAGNLQCIIDCEIGKNGAVLHKESVEGDGKTPICSTKVRHIDMPTENINNPVSAVYTKTTQPKINLGPCFVCLYVLIPKTNKIRGIGFHGSLSDKKGLSPTDGCIRLYNSELLLIRKYFFKNLIVDIR